AAARRSLTLASHAHIDAVVHACWDVHGDALHVAHAPLPVAALAGRGDNSSLASTAVADHDVDELAEDRLLYPSNLAGSLAARAACRRSSRLCTIATAVLAGLPTRNLDVLLSAAHRLLEAER